MSSIAASSSREHLLAELGVVRYRLRTNREGVAAAAAEVVAAAVAETVSPPIPAKGQAPAQPAPVLAPAMAGPDADHVRLRVCAAGVTSAPGSEPAAGIWAQVLAWAGLDSAQVQWCPAAPQAALQAGIIALPPPDQWADPDGKRALWLALKAPVRALPRPTRPAR